MNKAEFISAVSEKAGLTKKASGEAVDAILATIEESLVAGKEVGFIGFGTPIVTGEKIGRAHV